MNKELIKKYKAEFDHWLNGGKLLQKQINLAIPAEWEEFLEDWDWPIDKLIVIINDEYVEFRKALAEGNTIQYYECIYQHEMDVNLDRYDWLDWKSATHSSSFTKTLKYRIKPEEPKFKVGDWVVNKTSKQRIVKKITSIYSDTVTVGDTEVGINVMLINDLELWKPEKGEYCWFWNKGTTITILELLEIVDDGNIKYFAAMPNIPHSLGGYYQYCEPFRGTLPTKLRN